MSLLMCNINASVSNTVRNEVEDSGPRLETLAYLKLLARCFNPLDGVLED